MNVRNFKHLIKREMSAERNLIHFSPNEYKTRLVCDASKIGLGAVLLHILHDGTEKPIAYALKVLKKAEKNYSVIHKEALAIYWSVQKFYQYPVKYFSGHREVIFTEGD